MCHCMTQKEYKKIIKEALLDYCNHVGSILHIALDRVKKEYIYEFDKALPEDIKNNLIDKAYQAMKNGDDLPKGIRLKKVIFYKV